MSHGITCDTLTCSGSPQELCQVINCHKLPGIKQDNSSSIGESHVWTAVAVHYTIRSG